MSAAVATKATLQTTRECVESLVGLVEQGKFLEAFDAYYGEDVAMAENRSAPTVGKAENRAREEQFVGSVAQVHESRAKSVTVDSDRAVIEWVLDFTDTEGNRVRMEQVAVQEWQDGQVVHERFYYDTNALDAL